MNELDKKETISAEEKLYQSHEYLKEFIKYFDIATRGGIHDFIEIAVADMIALSVEKINRYLQTGHKTVNANEIMSITVDSFQKIVDQLKVNLDKMKQINFSTSKEDYRIEGNRGKIH